MTNHTSRRAVLGGTAALAAIATTTTAVTANPDAELIADCRHFAETELTTWYGEWATQDDPEYPDFDAVLFNKIVATPATTPEGMAAKALAYSSTHSALHDLVHESDFEITLLRSLMQDMAGRERAAILAKLAEQYGPLPACYDHNGRFIGYSAEHIEQQRQAEMVESGLLRALPPLTETAKMECVGLTKAGEMFLWQHRNIEPCSRISKSGDKGLYLIDWRGHALAAWISANEYRATIEFVGHMASASLPTWHVERLVMGREAECPELRKQMLDALRSLRERDKSLAADPQLNRGRIAV